MQDDWLNKPKHALLGVGIECESRNGVEISFQPCERMARSMMRGREAEGEGEVRLSTDEISASLQDKV